MSTVAGTMSHKGEAASPGAPLTGLLRRSSPLALVILFASVPMASAFREPLYLMDEALLLVYPEQILAGEVPNRDFFTSYGPGGLSLLAVIYAVVGPAVVAERAVGLLYHVAIATGAYAMARRLGSLPATTAGIVAGLILVPLGLLASSWLGAIALVMWSLALLDAPRSKGAIVLAGIFGALAVSWRPETAVLVVVAALPHLWRNPRWRQWGLGIVMGMAPLAIHTVLSGGRLWTNVAGRVGVNGNLRISLSDMDVIVALLITLGAAAYLAWCAYRIPSRRLLAWATASAVVLPQMLQRLDLGHVLNVACFILPLAVAWTMAHFDVAARLALLFGETQVKRIAWGAAGLLLVVEGVQSLAATTGSRPSVMHESRALPVLHVEEQRALDKLLRRVATLVPPGTKIFMGARDMSVPTLNDMRLYHLLPEYDAFAYNLELPPPQPVGSLLSQDLQKADALILRRVPRGWGRAMVPFVPPGDDAANDIVADQFCLAGSVHPYEIHLRCGAAE